MADDEVPSPERSGGIDSKPDLTPDSPKWIRNATAFVALMGTIVGICVSIWGLVAKSQADKEAAETNLKIAREKASSDQDIGKINLEIAKDQLAAHREEYLFQSQQHDKDQEQARSQYDRELRAKNEQRLTSIIDDLFSNSGYSEGKLDLLSTFITEDHAYDDLIANAIVAKVIYVKSNTEVAIAFTVLEKLQKSKAKSLISINQFARRRFDAALIGRFWIEMAREMKNAPTWDAPRAGQAFQGASPSARLFVLARDAEGKVLGDLVSEAAIDDPLYAAAKINRSIFTKLRDLHAPEEQGSDQPAHYAARWEEIKKTIDSMQPVSGEDDNASIEIPTELLKRTSTLIPLSLVDEGGVDHGPIVFSECYLWSSVWPSLSYPLIQFEESYIANADLTRVNFNRQTWKSLIPHPTVTSPVSLDESSLGDWQNMDPSWQMKLFLVNSSSSKDLAIPESVRTEWPQISREVAGR